MTYREFFEIQEACNRIVAAREFKGRSRERMYTLLKKKYTAAQLRKAGIRNDTVMDKRGNYKLTTHNKYYVDIGKIYALKRAGWNNEKIIDEFGSRPSRKLLMAAIKYVQNLGYRPPYMLEGEPEEEPEEPDGMKDDDWEGYED